MARSFNTTGPNNQREHYTLPPERRLGRIRELIDRKKYFLLRAGRQTGKTTSALWLVDHFNQGDQYRCLWVDLQSARDQPDPAIAFRTILNKIREAIGIQQPGVTLDEPDALLADPATALVRTSTVRDHGTHVLGGAERPRMRQCARRVSSVRWSWRVMSAASCCGEQAGRWSMPAHAARTWGTVSAGVFFPAVVAQGSGTTRPACSASCDAASRPRSAPHKLEPTSLPEFCGDWIALM